MPCAPSRKPELSNHRAHYDYYSLVLGYWGIRDMKRALENYQLAVQRDPRFGEYKTLNERTAEWTPLERRAIHGTFFGAKPGPIVEPYLDCSLEVPDRARLIG